MTNKLTTHDYARIGADAVRDARTVQRAYEGYPVTTTTRVVVRKAAERLGLPPPPEPVTA